MNWLEQSENVAVAEGQSQDESWISSDRFVAQFDGAVDDYLNTLITEALKAGASDFFFTPREETVDIAIRSMGLLRPWGQITRDFGLRLIAHLKVTANMDILRSFHPQDGRIRFRLKNSGSIDLRLATLPTIEGEDMTLRILDSRNMLTVEDIGFHRTNYKRLYDIASQPGGLILVTGPTGMGKTTTLYAVLKHLNDGTRKIHTLEDPIEYTLDGLHQSQINLSRGVDFPDLLRGILRQSPDVIMVGEIRDNVTADIVVRAANSGQLVLATSHARSTVEACEAMLFLGVQPQFFASCLLGVVTQRLVRKLCPQCKLSLHGEHDDGQKQMYVPCGCPDCNHSGYKGRIAVGEVLKVSQDLEKMIREGASMYQIHQRAVDEGMVDLRTDAQDKLEQGLTSVDEILRAVPGQFADYNVQ
ncbi:MAG: GspE/PulE family protein [Planctomycetaceae bacterium]|jgi:type II secretory ATPase GspE/PulE/Tfp pilus assembly ATPase PilB-like protein|nr:GspE/PulE family protein [Planctomycetaceae bacterium]